MQLHQLKPLHRQKTQKRVGRGGKRGTYSGRGGKGQKSRAGRKMQPLIRQLVKRYPKLRGYRHKSLQAKFRIAVLNLDILEKHFESGQTVNPKALLEKRLVRKIKGAVPVVKILGSGNLAKALIVEGCQLSKQAKDKIVKANGSVK